MIQVLYDVGTLIPPALVRRASARLPWRVPRPMGPYENKGPPPPPPPYRPPNSSLGPGVGPFFLFRVGVPL